MKDWRLQLMSFDVVTPKSHLIFKRADASAEEVMNLCEDIIAEDRANKQQFVVRKVRRVRKLNEA